jgi:hypothetical protein
MDQYPLKTSRRPSQGHLLHRLDPFRMDAHVLRPEDLHVLHDGVVPHSFQERPYDRYLVPGGVRVYRLVQFVVEEVDLVLPEIACLFGLTDSIAKVP